MKLAMSEAPVPGKGTKPVEQRKPAEQPRRGGAARSVADMVPDIGRAAFRRFGFVQSSVVSRWAEIVGDRYAKVSSPESIRFPQGKRSEGVLTLRVDGAHGTMMQHVGPTIIERVNRFFGYPAVARIVFRREVLPPQAMKQSGPSRVAPPSIKPVSIDLGESLRTVGDPELRACLASLAGALGATEGVPTFSSGDTDR